MRTDPNSLHGRGWETERLYHDWKDRMGQTPGERILVLLMIAAGYVLLLTMGSWLWLLTEAREIWYRCRKTPPERRVGYVPTRRYD